MAGESARDRARRLRERAERQQRVAELYERGAAGETATAEALNALPSEWVVLHDLAWPNRKFANIDHVVIGPGGVFVIDTKNWSGQVKLDGQTIRQNGRSRHKAVAGCAQASIAVGELIPLYIDYVYPVMCFHGRELAGTAYDVMVCSTGNVAEMLMNRPRVFGPSHVEFIRLALRASMMSATHEDRHKVAMATRTAPTLPVARSNRPVRSRGRRGPRLHLGRAVAGVALLSVAFVPQLREGLVGLVTEAVVPEKPATRCEAQAETSTETCAKPPAGKKGDKAKETQADN
ncbi:MAG TPA: nuclease-related domain-containing protein [Nocardioidaceae bacterium]|nr:nuclease-related domain-containing protein [Nocardioidaceae bacterium]